MQFLHAFDPDHIRSGAFDIGSHAVQEVGHIHHVGFFCRILDHGVAGCHHRCHHDIDGGPHSYHIQIDVIPGQAARFRDNHSMLDIDSRA